MKNLVVRHIIVFLLTATIQYSIQQSPACDNVIAQVNPEFYLARPRISAIYMEVHIDSPLRDCIFVLPNGEHVDLSLGHNATRSKRWNYFGHGLQQGDCGISLGKTYPNLIYLHGVIECRFRLQGCEKWEYRASKVRVTGFSGENLPKFKIHPQNADLTTGDSITITCNTNTSIEFCHFLLPGDRNLTFDQGPTSQSTAEYRYHGAGLASGDCGVTLTGVDERLNGYVVCKLGQRPHGSDGAWNIDAMRIKTSDTMCPPLTPRGVILSCYLNGNEVEPTGSQAIGTLARLSCKPGYVITDPNITYSQISCQDDAKWSQPIFECEPGCGRRNRNEGITLISHGRDSRINEFPWHIAVYELNEGTHSYSCGGTLISSTAIISAAHCFYDDTPGLKRDASIFRVAGGKHRRQWSLQDSGEQKRNVLQVVLPSRYSGRLTGFASDIAIIKVDRPFEVTAEVNFICMDWTNSLTSQLLVSGNNGTVVGWGFTQSGELSDTLKYVDLPYVSYEDCKKELTADLQAKLTHDKFCSGFKNRSTSVCPGDSGGGLVFRDPRSNTYFLQGVVSIAFSPPSNSEICYSQLYTGFTSLSYFITWVKTNK